MPTERTIIKIESARLDDWRATVAQRNPNLAESAKNPALVQAAFDVATAALAPGAAIVTRQALEQVGVELLAQLRDGCATAMAAAIEEFTGKPTTVTASPDRLRHVIWCDGQPFAWGEQLPDPAASAERLAARLDEHAN